MGKRWTFDGHIAGIGAQSGLRAVVGVWHKSPLGAFADVMVQLPAGQRIGRREFCGVTDVHSISEAAVVWEDQDQDALAPVMPAVTFGFSSVPAQPGIARVRTTIVEGPAGGDMSPSRRANK